jgi:hypothetical protein
MRGSTTRFLSGWLPMYSRASDRASCVDLDPVEGL